MREFSKISPQFWLGETAKKLRGHQEAQIVAMYLLSSPHANMIGMYYLPKMFISHETGLTLQGASKGLLRCIEAGFCSYDEEKEIIWVVEMANYQIGELKPSDKRSVGAQNEYLKVPDCNHSMAFFDKYSSTLNLTTSKGLRRGFDDPLKQEEEDGEEDGDEKGDRKESAPRGAGVSLLSDEGIDTQVASDFLAIRKAKRAPLTATALDGIKREAGKAGITLEDALRVCVERGWQGYKAEWDKREGQVLDGTATTPKTAQSGPYGRYVEQPMDYPLAEPDKDMYSGPVDPNAATSALAAMREKIKQGGEAF